MDKMWKVDFEKRIVALLGNPSICRHFYLQFHMILDIEYLFTTNIDYDDFLTDHFFKERQEIIFMPIKDSLIENQEILLILCVEHGDRKLYDKLFYLKGYEWGEDYIDFKFVVHFYRHKYSLDLKKKNIWVFGAGNNGRYFYKRYKDVYSIKGFISNFDEEKEYQGLPVIRPVDVLEQTDFYIVICSDADTVMSQTLIELGINGNRNYCFLDTMPQKLFIAMGTCQIIKVAETLNRNQSFSKRYHADFYFDNLYEPCSNADSRRMKAYGEYCDVVFYNVANAGTMEFRNYESIIQKFYLSSIRIFLPFYYFKGQVMQATNTVNKYTIKLLEKEWIWFRGDQEVNNMIENHDTVEDILEKISKDDYWTRQEIINNFEMEMKKIEVLDRFSSFPIKPFIEKNYQKYQIFLDGTHFSIHLCLYLANKIAGYLGLDLIREKEAAKEREYSYTSVMPIYPCVIHALGMEMENFYQFYNIENETTEYLSMKEYVEKYIRYVTNIREIHEKYGTIMAW